MAANALFRRQLQQAADEARVELHIAPLNLCTDNAVMGAIACEQLRAGMIQPLDLDIFPGLVRDLTRVS